MQVLRYIFWIVAALSGVAGWLMKQEVGGLWRLAIALAALALMALAAWTAYDLRRHPREPRD